MNKIFVVALITMLFSPFLTLAQVSDGINQEALNRLLAMKVEIVQIDENGSTVNQGDQAWIDGAPTYPLLNGSYIMVTGNGTIDEGSCKNAFGCSNNRFTNSVTIEAPTGWRFNQQSVASVERGHGKNGHGIDGAPISNPVPFGSGGTISTINKITVKHFCHRAGGYTDGGCASNLAVTALAVFVE